MNEVDEDARLLAEAHQALALGGVAQRVEGDLDQLVARGRVVVDGTVPAPSRTSRSPKASAKIATSSSSSSRTNEAASRVTCTKETGVSRSRSQVRPIRPGVSPRRSRKARTWSLRRSPSARAALRSSRMRSANESVSVASAGFERTLWIAGKRTSSATTRLTVSADSKAEGRGVYIASLGAGGGGTMLRTPAGWGPAYP